ncbi:MAG: 2-oxoglutarate dehydrogenase complex dihydrolipoyllysine-residue succinyltransferase [Pseudomonadota bacterium]|nr:2-oxoglutarate dehydrogenase complex dihydrolipoyllysine-residue succinyltransferase [Pseudomonadota bacterium]QKK05785.1 MAG: 2-oxoglutarate dehydrogenase complex dihydrolipoyllysine-residue succinyltransferase [Pseudomonadota bacterium]
MATEIIVPTLGESVTEATVAQWLKQVGDHVEVDDPLVELETDKVTLEVNASAAGVIKEIKVKEGENVAVGTVLGEIGAGAAAPAEKKAAAPKAEKVAAEPTANDDAAATLSPAVRKIVDDNNLDPSKITGTGKDGRLTKGDVLAYMEGGAEAAPQAAPQAAAPVVADQGPREERVRMTRLRQRIAERLKEAQNTAAMLTTFNEIDMTNCMALRAQYKDSFEKRHGIKLGFMSFFIKACIQALKDFPAVNASIDGDELVYKNYYDIGVAVSTPTGLVVPVLRDADKKSFADVEAGIVDLGTRARDGKLEMSDLTGGTFTITNGGVFGSLMSTPILNVPQSGILGMHSIQERPVAVKGEVKIRPMMYIALSYDHRIIDGREAVSFLVRVKDAVEDPQRLLLDL